MNSHLEQDAVDAYVRGGMTTEEKTSMDMHASGCHDCRRAIALAAMSLDVSRRIRTLLLEEDDETIAA